MVLSATQPGTLNKWRSSVEEAADTPLATQGDGVIRLLVFVEIFSRALRYKWLAQN